MGSASFRAGLIALGLVALGTIAAQACSTPVFRVALIDPKWRPEPYEFSLFHRGPLDAADREWLKGLNDYLDKNDGHVNCVLQVIDLDKKQPADAVELFRKQGQVTLPYLVVRHPEVQNIGSNLWAGPLHEAPLRTLLESPARAEISKRILAGDSAVWVLLESGDKARDDAGFALLHAQLDKLEKTLKLPDLKAADNDKYTHANAPPLKLAFSALRLARTDAAEKWFVEMLLLTEDDLKSRREPIVVPIYGRGVALYALVGKGINEHTIATAAGFVVGECSCEVRRDNPGKDLLMVAPWDTGQPLPAVANLLFMPPEPARPAVTTSRAVEGVILPELPWYERLDPVSSTVSGLVVGLLAIGGFGAYFLARSKGSL